MNKPKKTKSNKKFNVIIIIFLMILLIPLIGIGIFYGGYNYVIAKSSSSYEKTVADDINTLNKINKTAGSLIKSNSIDKDQSLKQLPDFINKLSTLKLKVQSEQSTDEFISSQKSLLNGIADNILIYRQIYSMLQNDNSNDLSTSLDSLMKYKDDCTSYYSKVNINGLAISLPTEASNYIKVTNTFITQVIKINNDTAIKKAQLSDFVQSIDTILDKFTPLKTDFSEELNKARTGSISFDDAATFINNTNDKYSEVQQAFSAITIPSDPDIKKTYKALNTVFNDYSDYIQQMIFSVQNEKAKTSGQALDKDTLNSLYSTANNKFSVLNTDYSDFFNKYTQLKNQN
jgi:hypothetical protein